MTTLENSYCVPRDSEWDKFGLINLNGNIIIWRSGTWTISDPTVPQGYSEIPVQHFIDLVEDRISAWRLREVEFRSTNTNDNASNVFFRGMSYMASIHVSYIDGKLHDISIEPCGGEDVASIDELNISTFTDLLTLIKFLTPPTK